MSLRDPCAQGIKEVGWGLEKNCVLLITKMAC